MTPMESAQLNRLADDVRVVRATVMAQAMFGARPWVPMVIGLLCAVVTAGGVLRVELTISRLEERLQRLEARGTPVAVAPVLRAE